MKSKKVLKTLRKAGVVNIGSENDENSVCPGPSNILLPLGYPQTNKGYDTYLSVYEKTGCLSFGVRSVNVVLLFGVTEEVKK